MRGWFGRDTAHIRMIGIVIVTHGRPASAARRAAIWHCPIFGKISGLIKRVSVRNEMAVAGRRRDGASSK